jgi:hypothetical protein
MFNREMTSNMSDPAILRLICLAREFDNIRVREEELAELDELKQSVHLEVGARFVCIRVCSRTCVCVRVRAFSFVRPRCRFLVVRRALAGACTPPAVANGASFVIAVHACVSPAVQVWRGERGGQDQRADAGERGAFQPSSSSLPSPWLTVPCPFCCGGLQAYISRLPIKGFTLSSDTSYITQSAGRVSRALFEVKEHGRFRRPLPSPASPCFPLPPLILLMLGATTQVQEVSPSHPTLL